MRNLFDMQEIRPYLLELSLLAVAIVCLGAAITMGLIEARLPARKSFESDIEVIHQAQRECLKRSPAHSFALMHERNGYVFQCSPIPQGE